MPERLTWDEITERYPDEWVLLVEIDEHPGDIEITSARVVSHSSDPDRVESDALSLPVPRQFGVFFTGPLIEQGVVPLL